MMIFLTLSSKAQKGYFNWKHIYYLDFQVRKWISLLLGIRLHEMRVLIPTLCGCLENSNLLRIFNKIILHGRSTEFVVCWLFMQN